MNIQTTCVQDQSAANDLFQKRTELPDIGMITGAWCAAFGLAFLFVFWHWGVAEAKTSAYVFILLGLTMCIIAHLFRSHARILYVRGM